MKTVSARYTPQFFLASLGNGGLTVSIYMYLMFLVPHPGKPMANFEHIYPVLTGGNPLTAILTGAALLGILFFAFRHFQTLIWNLRQYKEFSRQADFAQFASNRGGAALMTVPLTLAMSVNVAFILGGAFVPKLWSVVEFLFPFAILAFGAIGIYALRIFVPYATRFLQKGGLTPESTNTFSPMISAFAFSMVAVGFSASAAMSHVTATSVIGFLGAVFFGILSIGITLVEFSNGLRGVLAKGIQFETSHSFWMMIPILTILGIASVRLTAFVSHNVLETAMPSYFLLVLLATLAAIQGVFGILGYTLMKSNGYFSTFVTGKDLNPGSYGLICPGVASFVLGMFLIGWGFVENGIVTKYSLPHIALIATLALIQIKTISTMFTLDKKYFFGKVAALETARENA